MSSVFGVDSKNLNIIMWKCSFPKPTPLITNTEDEVKINADVLPSLSFVFVLIQWTSLCQVCRVCVCVCVCVLCVCVREQTLNKIFLWTEMYPVLEILNLLQIWVWWFSTKYTKSNRIKMSTVDQSEAVWWYQLIRLLIYPSTILTRILRWRVFEKSTFLWRYFFCAQILWKVPRNTIRPFGGHLTPHQEVMFYIGNL